MGIPFSFELFPPKTEKGAANLSKNVARLAEAGPEYFSVTHGAGGSAQQGTYDTVVNVSREVGAEAAPHLTCVGSTRARVREQLLHYRQAGVRRIVALRGDLPATAHGSEAPGDFHYANELVRFIREEHGDHFRIEVAAYPEVHPQAKNVEADFRHFQHKVETGADAAITQYFFNIDAFDDFMERCAKARLAVPVIPGVMPIMNFEQLVRFSQACGADIPRWLYYGMARYAEDTASLRAFGTEVVGRLCQRLIERKAPALHFYTLNQAEPTLRLLEVIA